MDLNGGGDQDDINRKREKIHQNQNGDVNSKRLKRNGAEPFHPKFLNDNEEENCDLVELTLRCGPAEPPKLQINHIQPPLRIRSSPEPPRPENLELMRNLREERWALPPLVDLRTQVASPQPRGRTNRRQKRNSPAPENNEIIPAPYPWATTKHATVHSIEYLEANRLITITGLVQGDECDNQYEMQFNLHEKFEEIKRFIYLNKTGMHDRAPVIWLRPNFPKCRYCNQDNCCAKPVIGDKKEKINWLFLLLGQTLGRCTLDQLKYFCQYTNNHRTGAKDRVLYLSYLTLCRQLDPSGPFYL